MRQLIILILALVMSGAVAAPVPTQAPPPQRQAQTKEQTVYITKTGKKYHRGTCRYLSRSKIPVSLKDAQSNGYTPCSVCNPPR
jgi:competence protein ComEC